MLIAIVVIAGLAILILGHEAGHFFVAKLFGMKVDEFGFGFPPRIKAIKKGETEYSFNWLPFGGFVKISGEEEQITNPEKLQSLSPEEKKRYFLFQPAWKRFLVIASGVLVNFIIGWLAISFVLMAGASSLIVVNGVQPGSPAENAGIATGDIIKNYSSSGDFKNFINENRGRQTTFEIIRGGKDLKFTAVPRVSTGPNEGALGIEFSETGIERQNFSPALISGFKESILISQATISAFYELFKNLIVRGSLMDGVVGPVGIFVVAEQTGHFGLIYLLQLLGLISLNLAVLNLIPFPALDGGRLFLIILEKIKGSPVSIKTQSLVNGVGFAMLLFLMAIITVRDVVNLF